MDNHKDEKGALEATSALRDALRELRSDLFNLQKFASCSLTHLDVLLQAQEKPEEHTH